MIEIIPAIDLIEGKCVRLTQGDYGQKTIYNENPLEVALQFEDAGLKRLHLVDLDGAKAKKVVNWKVLDKIASRTSLHIDFGGGVQSDDDLKIVFENGAKQVTGGSIAVKQPDLFQNWISVHGGEKIILGADAKKEKVAVSGWEEGTEIWVYDFVEQYVEKGIQYAISTDVAKDGLLQGPSFDLYRNLQDKCPDLKIIASGGVSGIGDVEKLAEMNVYGVIIGKAIYENRISLVDLQRFSN
ncbi:1-(5-phosphoribosyl)-5-[(5-phosphoribosylamino)methylideneamino]imidazole-4-carboxamide isomerase [Dyadobacter sediminis]|uniref:1-(5-phosphoribosyl)-5-[(5-phosphoribosylamino)methylideneamino] imidazole-4-carboxamide isomerase n=1 Tax=Dyadobacter sediminis TaxID=1493691 RepID=A0A5R9K8G1_9BACT|nr:1-(5-phosphoribosyl)-5-[(5-phosphoribosylamino)methylideneamino]imidazole-4-carboxamide isomerase [Dyadobacter sediminis]TLU90341.1 1-(5-phosphoribosyl)-5-[(5-phosphoribosylamino)methylideneamino]imidazole-4-carboxamide isomerase [Dyadobacter sediminis]GGC07014.1 1-(5-phosphoribosyl)-5-[(5-phosphoribosylamino) methylideneamino] imidazole-4-carboxamide isomerase [Dyadobacter sediminis]